MTTDDSKAALAEAIRRATRKPPYWLNLPQGDWDWDEDALAAAILGERGVFWPTGKDEYRELIRQREAAARAPLEAEIERLQERIARQASASPELAIAFDAVRSEAEITRLRTALERADRWIVDRQLYLSAVDHACAECVPGGPIVSATFRCAFHEAKARAALAPALDDIHGTPTFSEPDWADHRTRCHNDNPDAVIAHLHEVSDRFEQALRIIATIPEPAPEAIRMSARNVARAALAPQEAG